MVWGKEQRRNSETMTQANRHIDDGEYNNIAMLYLWNPSTGKLNSGSWNKKEGKIYNIKLRYLSYKSIPGGYYVIDNQKLS